MGKNKSFWHLSMAKEKFWPARMRFELCTPVLKPSVVTSVQRKWLSLSEQKLTECEYHKRARSEQVKP